MIRENQRLLNIMHIIVDAVIIAFSFLLAYQLRFDDTWSPLIKYHIINPPIGYYKALEDYRNMLVLLIPCYIAIYYICGMYDPKRTSGRRSEFFSLIKASILGMAYTVAILYFLLKEHDYARLFLGIFMMLNVTIDYTFRLIVIKILHNMRKSGKNLKHIILVGYSRTTERYIDRLRVHPEWGYYIHGILDDNKKPGTSYKHVNVIGSMNKLSELLATNQYDEIAITLSINEYNKLENIVSICEKSGVHTKFLPDYNNVIPTKPYTEDLDGIPVIHVRHVPLSSSFNQVLKRIVDIFGSLVAIILFAIPMLISAIIIKITSPGPLIFKQTRIGLHNQEFSIYKFRSMKVQDEAKEKKAWTTANDPRVTRFGKFMRKTNIDELPQLFNVLLGDMSLVGPRPERPFFVDKFKEEIPRYMIKHQVRPGMTGWAQVNGYRGDTSITKRIECDLYYVENWSIFLDFKILFLTFFGNKVNKNAY
ncbi:MAG: undecaprenyl-phosphate glucose phosphotransferase [Lachnospiraceae bacterium]|nr:undecaprenyl-phosphate glucose phosphotransferase [Lachnospiraceae bacterium]